MSGNRKIAENNENNVNAASQSVYSGDETAIDNDEEGEINSSDVQKMHDINDNIEGIYIL